MPKSSKPVTHPPTRMLLIPMEVDPSVTADALHEALSRAFYEQDYTQLEALIGVDKIADFEVMPVHMSIVEG